MKIKSRNISPVILQREVLDEVVFQVSRKHCGHKRRNRTDSDVRARIGKARAAFIVLTKIWKSREMSILTNFF